MQDHATSDKPTEVAHIPTVCIVGCSALFYLVGLVALTSAGRWFMLGTWPGQFKLKIAYASGTASAVVFAVGWRSWRRHRPPHGAPIQLTCGQTLLIVAAVFLIGTFGTWYVWGPPYEGPVIGS